MSKVLDLIRGLTGSASTNDVTATNTPTLDDASKKLATTEFMLQAFTGEGKQSISPNGYQKLPGGLIVQWGGVATNASGAATWTYPIPFPNGCYRVFATAVFGGTYYGASINGTPTDTSAAIKLSAAVVSNVNVFAIGH